MALPGQPSHGERITRATWVKEAVDLATKGYSLRRIGEQVGRHWTTVGEALNREYERARPTEAEILVLKEMHREKLHSSEERLNRLIQAHWPAASGALTSATIDDSEALEGLMVASVDAAKIVLESEKRLDAVRTSLAKLDGLNAPAKQEITGKDGAALVPFDMSKLSDEQLQRIAEGDTAALAVGPAEAPAGSGEEGAGSESGESEPT